MTYRECYEKGCLALQTAGIEEATLDARLLLEAVRIVMICWCTGNSW